MFYGIRLKECYSDEKFDKYIVFESESPEELFNEFECEAVFNNIDSAEGYIIWLES